MTLTPEQRRDWAQEKIKETTWPHTVWPAIARWLELTDDNFEVVEAAINVGVAGGNPQAVIAFYLQTWRVKVEAAAERDRQAAIRDILETGDAGLSKKPILLRNTTGGRNMTRAERRRQEQEQRRQAKRRRRPLTIQVILDDDQAVTAAAAAEGKEQTDGSE